MYKLQTLKNGLTLITIDLPHLESVTTLLAVGAGSRYETRKNNGISHFLEHMFFKGSKKYPTAEIISNLVDGIGAINNAGTDKDSTFYWIKSSANHIDLASDVLSSMIKESLLSEEEIEREKGVIVEEIRMYKDMPQRYVWDLYERLQFGDQPLGWDIIGDETTVASLKREDFINYIDNLYSPQNMALVFAGKLPSDVEKLAEKYFLNLSSRSKKHSFEPFQPIKQTKPEVNIYYKKTDQANIVLGVKGYKRQDQRSLAARLLAIILGEGMSSRLFRQVRERRGLAYHVSASFNPYQDTGSFTVYAGLKLEKLNEGIKVIKAELARIASEKVTEDELNKAKEIYKGRRAISSESTNFLAEYFGINYILDHEVETIDERVAKIKMVTAEEVQNVAKELFKLSNYNLQIIGPFKDKKPFESLLLK